MNTTQFIIHENQTAREALDAINSIALPALSLFVTNKNKQVIGTLSEGDIRRGLLAGKQLDLSVTEFMHVQFNYFEENKNNFERFNTCKKLKIRFVPTLNAEKQLVAISDLTILKSCLPATALLMAGGLGERLRPLTDSVPKPLLKVGDKAIIDYNIDNLKNHGVHQFHISLKYKADMIVEHFTTTDTTTSFNFIKEDEPRGTAGALSELKDLNTDYVILMNSDLLTNIDFASLYEKLQQSNADMVMATIPYNVDIPYAIVEVDAKDTINALTEKPRYTYYANAGIYFMKKEIIKHVPTQGRFDATDLAELLIKQGYKVVSQPILDYWLDIGRPEDFAKAQNDIKYLQF